MEDEEERWTLTEDGVETARKIHAWYLGGYTIEDIADELSIEKEGVQVLYAMANCMGVLD